MARVESKIVTSPYTGQEETFYVVYTDNGDFVGSTYDNEEAYGKLLTRARRNEEYNKQNTEIVSTQESTIDNNSSDDTNNSNIKSDEEKNTEQTETTEKDKLQEPINFTDPYVLHDVKMDKPSIVHLFQQTDMNSDDNEGGNNNEVSSIKTNGILYPLIQINTKVIDYTQIIKMKIYYDSFLPEIELTINDPGELMQRTDLPGLNNTLKVIIVPELQNVYKTIALEFKILSYETNYEEITFFGKYQIREFNKKRTKELIYAGCSNKKEKTDNKESQENTELVNCNPSENKQPNTWEMLHIIANECQLGFSSTDKCQDINDRLPRLVMNKSYEDFILNQLQFSGLNEDSIFDTWVDLYGYLVMVNVSWILNNDKVSAENLGIYAFTGLHGTDDNNEPEQEPILVPRTLTNFSKTGTPNNLAFEEFEIIINNNDLLLGTSVSMYNFGLLDIGGGNNAINQYDVDIVRDDVDDKKVEDYGVQQQLSMVIECNDLPINKQELIRKKFFSKHRQRLLIVKLLKINLGIQRGTLINVAIFETEMRNKQYALSQASNAYSSDPHTFEEMSESDLAPDNDPNNNMHSDVMNDSGEILNVALSGMYYIDGIKFEYSYEENEITQYLMLIKKSNLSSLNNLTTAPKIDTNSKESVNKTTQSSENIQNDSDSTNINTNTQTTNQKQSFYYPRPW